MQRRPLVVQKVGDVSMKVWRVAVARAASGVAFKHRRRGGCCNCAAILTEVAKKHTPAVLAVGKLCVPLQMIHCDSGTTEGFLLELRPLRESSVCPPSASFDLCLRSNKCRGSSNINEMSRNENCEIERVKKSYEQIIKDLIKNVSSKYCVHRSKDNIDKSEIIELCLKNNVATDKIVSLLNDLDCNKELECQDEYECNNEYECSKEPECDEELEEEHLPNICSNCMESEENQQSKLQHCDNDTREQSVSHSSQGLRTKKFKIVPSTSISDIRCCVDNSLHDCSRPVSPCSSNITDKHHSRSIPMYKTVRANYCRSRQSDINHDIKEIKRVLNDIITVISSNDPGDSNLYTIPTITNNKNVSEENKCLNTDEILNLILRHVSQCKYDPSDECNEKETSYLQSIDNWVSHDTLCREELHPKYIPIIDNEHHIIYRCLPKTIPLIKNTSKMSTAPTTNQLLRPSGTINHSTKIESQLNTIDNNVHIKETPPALVEYLNTLLPPVGNNGVTHIHYYSKNDAGLSITGTQLLDENSERKGSKQELERNAKDILCKDDFTKGYSHIIIDINAQLPLNKNIGEVINENLSK